MRRFARFTILALGALVAAQSGAVGTTFTYQGVLQDSGTPSASYDFEVWIYGVASGGTPLVGPLIFDDVALDQDRFLLTIDPGVGVFDGADRWLELRVRRGSETGAYTTLAPRQPVYASPYAQHSSTADFAAMVAAGSVTTVEIANGAVSSAKIGDGQVMTADIGNSAVSTAKLGDLSVTTGKLANAAVTAAKIDPSQVQARIGGACANGEFATAVEADGDLVCATPALGEGLSPILQGEVTLVSGSGVSDEFDAAIGARGTLLVAYYDDVDGDLELLRCEDVACTSVVATTLLSAGITGRTPQIEVRANGLPAIAFHDDTDGSINVLDCADVDCATFATVEIIDTPGLVLTDMALVFSGMNMVLTWYDSVGDDLEVAYCPNSSPLCGSAILFTAAATGDVGSRAAVTYAVDTFDPFWIAYRNDTTNTVDFIACSTGGSCDPSLTLYGPVANYTVGDHIDIALGADNLAIVSHVRNGASSGFVQISHCEDPNCNTVTNDNVPVSIGGGIPSTAVLPGRDGRPKVLLGASWVHCGDPACAETTRSVGVSGRVGRLVRGADGRDGVVSAASTSLRYLRCINRWCSPSFPPD